MILKFILKKFTFKKSFQFINIFCFLDLIKAAQEGRINGIQFSPLGPSINHLLFAVDSMFLLKAFGHQCEQLQSILEQYGSLGGQAVNLEKSSITFGIMCWKK